MSRKNILKTALALSVASALCPEAHGQQGRERQNRHPGPAGLRRDAAGISGDVRARAARYEPAIAAAAARHGVDPRVLWTIAFLETRFRPGGVSYKNGEPCAYGLMQFIPATAERYGLRNPLDAAASIEAAARYVRDLSARFGGRFDLVLAGYNAGEGAVEAYRKGVSIKLPGGRRINPNRLRTGGVPPYAETRNYVARGFAVAREISRANVFPRASLAASLLPLPQPAGGGVSDPMVAPLPPSGAGAAPTPPASSYASGERHAALRKEGADTASELNDAAPRPPVLRSYRATSAAKNVSSDRAVEHKGEERVIKNKPATVVSTQTRSTYAGGAAGDLRAK